MTLGDRIKKVRKSFDLTQQEFADRIGSKRNTVATYEIDRSTPSAAIISLICREFNINEDWLKMGQGEMFVKITRDEEIALSVEKMLKGKKSSFKNRLISVLSDLSEHEWEILEKRLKEILATREESPSLEQESPPLPDTRSIWEKEADEFAEIARQQYLAEKKRESRILSVKESDVG